jgi:hypothetical protein
MPAEKPDFGAFIAVGRMGLRMISKDGSTWSQPQMADKPHTLSSIAVGKGCVVTAGMAGSGENVFYRSTDLQTWEMQKQKSDYVYMLRSLGFGNGAFLALLSGGVNAEDGGNMQSSDDGVKWSERFKREKRSLNKILWDGKQWLGIGNYGLKSVSADGHKWIDAENQAIADTLIAIAYGNGRYVGVGLHGLRMASPDGLRWGEKQMGEEGEHLHAVVFTGKEFVAVGLGATYSSPDGVKWKRTPNEDPPVSVAYGNGVFVGAAYKGRLLVSKDGITWKQVLKTPDHVQAVAFV